MNRISVTGTYLESCSCKDGCLCCAPESPTRSQCHVSAAWNLEEGHVGGTAVNGLGVVQITGSDCTTHRAESGRIYIDERATSEQRRALEKVLTLRDSPRLAMMGRFPATGESIHYGPVRVDRRGDAYHVEVPGVLSATLQTALPSWPATAAADMEVGSLESDTPRTYAFISRFQWSE